MPSKGRELRGSSGEQVTPPRVPDITPPPMPSGDYTYTVEIVMRMQETMGRLTEAVDTLKTKQSDQTKKLEKLSQQMYAAIVLVVVFGGIITFFAKSINDLIFHYLTAQTQQQQVQPTLQPQQQQEVPKQVPKQPR